MADKKTADHIDDYSTEEEKRIVDKRTAGRLVKDRAWRRAHIRNNKGASLICGNDFASLVASSFVVRIFNPRNLYKWLQACSVICGNLL